MRRGRRSGEEGQLFDLAADPGESVDLWDSASAEPAAAKLRLRREVGRWRAHSALHTADMHRAHR
ncbi:hypothetical protein [Streptomonospora wellingtoniae]|uniref:Uncharacterized protein n=1 Tax=Streptomonospora wellingtoniae TaxID=3075544 RepID=A0ABU2KNM9_9ACTN|nr:hypothetical protein [Streptomonospora sp. DSM 45055]MDT0300870.1 hypothetical protein [Streptomonospora sp. DSM 45055]